MEIISKDLHKSNKYDGAFFWVCDYRFNTMDKKPIRHIKPMRVQMRQTIEDHPFYNGIHYIIRFYKLNKKGEASASNPLKLWDNTSWAEPLKIFTEEAECRAAYRALCIKNEERLYEWFRKCKARRDSLEEEFEKAITENSP